MEQLSPDDFRLIQEIRIPMEAIGNAVGKAAENFTAEADKEFSAIVEKMAGSGISEVDVKKFPMRATSHFTVRSGNSPAESLSARCLRNDYFPAVCLFDRGSLEWQPEGGERASCGRSGTPCRFLKDCEAGTRRSHGRPSLSRASTTGTHNMG